LDFELRTKKELSVSHAHSGQGALLEEPVGDVAWVIRTYKEADLPAIVSLLNAHDAAYKLNDPTSEEELRVVNESPRSDPPRQVVVVEGPRIDGVPAGTFAGSGRVNYDDDEASKERIYFPRVVVHPAAEGMGLESAIAARLMEIVRGYESDPAMKPMDKATIKVYLREELHPLRDLWERAGMKEVRQFWEMARPLHEPIDEPVPVEGVDIRPYIRPEDNVRANEAFNNSFSDHWDHHEVPQEDWDYWTNAPNTRVDLSWLAESEEEPGKITGFCIISISEAANKHRSTCEGWVEILGTTGAWRRKGLGRALLLHGLHSLKSAGMDTAMLGVDSTSLTGANRLYESVGFRIRSREVQYECKLEEIAF
jgi:mycothiol synthase